MQLIRGESSIIAEIYNKLSATGSNLHDRLEDQLTGNVFGALRYLPFEQGLRFVLSNVQFDSETRRDVFHALTASIPNDAEPYYRFWPKHPRGEIDLIVETSDAVIGIEVKYLSGLSSDDEIDHSYEQSYTESVNQLARYQDVLLHYAKGSKRVALIFLAPEEMAAAVYEDVNRRKLISPETPFGMLTWENVLLSLESNPAPLEDRHRQIIYNDLIELLRKKNFERFKGFGEKFLPAVTKVHYGFDSHLAYPTDPIRGDDYYVYR